MSTLEANMALLATFPEEKQQEIHSYLVMNCNKDNPFRPLSKEEICEELAESRECFSRGEYMDFGMALDEIGERYDL